VLCAVIAGLLHYLFTASFAWMCLEGVQLYLLVRNLNVVKYSSRQGLRRRFLLLAGYGSPALIVAVSAGVFPEGYGSNTLLLTFKAIAHCFIMGCSWILGFFQGLEFFRFVFVIINSLQGPFIFLVHCVLNQQVRMEYRKWFGCIYKQKDSSELRISIGTVEDITLVHVTKIAVVVTSDLEQKHME
ncbi:UNVERIFIED_CONTAM: hypothetical protein FKN15_003014, partial [Acipenser sinensis]